MKNYIKMFLLLAVVSMLFFACGKPSLSIDKTTVKKGETITVKWTAPGSFDKSAWIGMIPSKIPHGDEAKNDQHDLTYMYLNKKTSGSFTFTAPNKKGSFDFRMNDSDSGGKEVASVTFKVQ